MTRWTTLRTATPVLVAVKKTLKVPPGQRRILSANKEAQQSAKGER